MSMRVTEHAGYFGKIPSKSDFVQGGLPGLAIRNWDNWLAHAIHESQQALGDNWLQTYLSSPIWRFSLDPGILSENGWTGVLASSVDSVNRAYPLMLAMPFQPDVDTLDAAEILNAWLEQVEELTIRVIDGALDVSEALNGLEKIGQNVRNDLAMSEKRLRWRDRYGVTKGWLVLGDGFPPVAALRTAVIDGIGSKRQPAGRTCWWHAGWSGYKPAATLCLGLPNPKSFAGFLDGAWEHHNWVAQQASVPAS